MWDAYRVGSKDAIQRGERAQGQQWGIGWSAGTGMRKLKNSPKKNTRKTFKKAGGKKGRNWGRQGDRKQGELGPQVEE